MQGPIESPTLAAGGWALAGFAVYLLVLLAVGLLSARYSSRGVGEFFVGGRRMNRVVVALSAVASGRSAWLLLGLTGMAYTIGASALWAVVGYSLSELVLFLTVAPRLRRFAEAFDCITLPDFFAERFGDRDGWLRGALALVILLFMVSYVAAQFDGGGKAISASFGLSEGTGVLVTAAIVLAYTALGGFLAVSVTDAIQAGLMLFGLVVVPVSAVTAVGGWGEVVRVLQVYDPSFADPMAVGFGVWLGLVGIGLGSVGNPHIVIRYMSIDDPANLRFAGVLGATWNVVMGAGAVLVGIVGRVHFPGAGGLPGGDTENLFPALASLHLHPVLFGLVVASIFAAIMSTADSQLLVAASTVVRDLYQKVMSQGAELSEVLLVRMSRAVVIVLVLLSLMLGLAVENLVYWLALFAWAGLGAALGPPTILALYWRGATRQGVLAGVATGTVVTVVWYLSPALKGVVYELIPAFALSFAATWVVSRATRPPPRVKGAFRAMARPHAAERE